MKRKERNRETNTNHIMRRKKKKVVKIKDPLVKMEEKLDPDMQLDIIFRLPFKEAVQCRCVCKSWRTLLDDDFLINIHAKTLLKRNGYDHHHAHNYSYSSSSSSSRLSFISTPRTSTHEDDYDSTNDDDNDSTDDDVDNVIFGVYDADVNDMCSYKESRSSLKYPLTSFRYARIISSCNGLICLSINTVLPGNTNFMRHANNFGLACSSSIIIYNPITKENLNLRTYDEHSWHRQYKILTCGFGYHPSNKQYKILRCSYHNHELNKQHKILRCSYNNHEFQRLWFEIYTLGTTGKWRQIKAPEDPNFDYHVPGVHVNGALYWITNYFKNKKKRMIMSFDLGDDEEFRIITSLPPPHSNNINKKQGSSLVHYKLKESQGCLYLIVEHSSSEDDHSYIEIWLMMKKEKKRRMPEKTETTKMYKRDHRHHYSWTKVMKISTDHHRKGEYEFAGLTKSDSVILA